MTDVNLDLVEDNVHRYVTTRQLIAAAAGVANAIHAGLGGMIKGTLMEQGLRDALGLRPGDLVNIPKGSGPTVGDERV